MLRTLLRAAGKASALQALRPFTSEFIRILPDLSDLFSNVTPEPERAHEPEQEKRRLVHAFTLLVSEIAARQPHFLFIEDLHWCDEASLDALLYLARHLAAHPVLLVLTYRSDEVHGHLGHMLTQLDRERLAAEMRLHPLSVTELIGPHWLRAIFGLAQPVRADQLNLVYGLSDGAPHRVGAADHGAAACARRSAHAAPTVGRGRAGAGRSQARRGPAHEFLQSVAGEALLARLYHATSEWNSPAKRGWLHMDRQRLAATIEEADLRDAFLQAALADIPRAARVPHPRLVPRSPDLLSVREREVAELIAGGKSNHEIADALVVSERTVTTHVSHILGKLGFTSRTQIVAWLVEGPSDEP